jgi:hypothetical protein
MKKNWLLWGAVAVGAYLIYKKMSKDTGNGKDLAPPPVSNPSTKPAPSTATGSTSNNDLI